MHDDNDEKNPDLVEALRKTKANNDSPGVETFEAAVDEVSWVPLRYFAKHPRFRKAAFTKIFEFWDDPRLTDFGRQALENLRFRMLECLCCAHRIVSDDDDAFRDQLKQLKPDDTKQWIEEDFSNDSDL